MSSDGQRRRKRADLRSHSHDKAIDLFKLPDDDRLRLRDLLAQVQADSAG